MNFTYEAYRKLIELLKENNYMFVNYKEGLDKESNFNKVILRHDIDDSLDKALKFAILENELGVKSTYFLLISTDMYNPFSKKSKEKILKIQDLEHEIGLHFDETVYSFTKQKDIKYYVEKESKLLEEILGRKVSVVSMHRPSKYCLENDIKFEEMINSYSKLFFKEWKYISDSRMNWRENIFEIIKREQYKKIHLLTHPFSYSLKELSTRRKLLQLVNNANKERYYCIKDNFTNIDEFLKLEDIINQKQKED